MIDFKAIAERLSGTCTSEADTDLIEEALQDAFKQGQIAAYEAMAKVPQGYLTNEICEREARALKESK